MTDTSTAAPPPKPSFLRRLVPLAAAVVLGGAGFFATWSGLVDLPRLPGDTARDAEEAAFDFVPIRGLSVPLGPGSQMSELRFSADIEVRAESHAEMTRMIPRFLDVLNGFLRALEPEEVEEPAALVRLRALMLRRLQVVAGGDHVRDLLITEFVLR